MLKIPETPEIPRSAFWSSSTNHELAKALRAKGWDDTLSQKVIDDPKLALLLVYMVINYEDLKRLMKIRP